MLAPSLSVQRYRIISPVMLALSIVAIVELMTTSSFAMTMMPGNQTKGKMMSGNMTGNMTKGNMTSSKMMSNSTTSATASK
jgi:hypothetical protein